VSELLSSDQRKWEQKTVKKCSVVGHRVEVGHSKEGPTSKRVAAGRAAPTKTVAAQGVTCRGD